MAQGLGRRLALVVRVISRGRGVRVPEGAACQCCGEHTRCGVVVIMYLRSFLAGVGAEDAPGKCTRGRSRGNVSAAECVYGNASAAHFENRLARLATAGTRTETSLNDARSRPRISPEVDPPLIALSTSSAASAWFSVRSPRISDSTSA
jgi:hypothetical protein